MIDTSPEAIKKMAAAVEAYSKCAGAVKMLRALAAEKRAAQGGVTARIVCNARAAAEDADPDHPVPSPGQIRAALEVMWPGDVQDAKRYRWLRQHFRFANDSLHELWFDASLEPNDAGVPADLDQELDAAMGSTP